MLPTIYVMVGLPGSGKSKMAIDVARTTNAVICSADKMRLELFGSEEDQSNNPLVSVKLEDRIKQLLLQGYSVIFDTTNIEKVHRLSFLKKLENILCKKVCLVVSTPYKECLKRNNNRKRVVPLFRMQSMRDNFSIPTYDEGWDIIKKCESKHLLNVCK